MLIVAYFEYIRNQYTACQEQEKKEKKEVLQITT